MSRIYNYCPSILRRDAIGYSVTSLHRALLRSCAKSFLVCDKPAIPTAPPFTLDVEEMIGHCLTRDDILIFHYSFLDRNTDRILALPCRKIIIYHNITPGHFFRQFGQTGLADACDAGRAALTRMSGGFDAVVGVSAYNCKELADHGFPEARVIPVFYNDAFYQDRRSSHEAFLRNRASQEVQLVFIGRFVPNKRIDNVIRVAAVFKRLFRMPVRLRLHGKVWDRAYFHGLRRLVEQLDMEAEVSFVLNQPQAALRDSLASADAFVSASEHEGFMVPLVEAFSAGAPVVALASSAVGETCGFAGCLVREFDAERMAATVLATRQDRDLRMNLLQAQSKRAAMFTQSQTLKKWETLFNDLLPQPLVMNYAHRI